MKFLLGIFQEISEKSNRWQSWVIFSPDAQEYRAASSMIAKNHQLLSVETFNGKLAYVGFLNMTDYLFGSAFGTALRMFKYVLSDVIWIRSSNQTPFV